jgi:Protein of unknown function (DUF3769)
MLHPVPPPPKPAILDSQAATNLAASSKSEPTAIVVNDASTVNEQLVAPTPAKTTQPEKFPPEFTPETVSKSAASLGGVLTIGYPSQDNNSQKTVFPPVQQSEEVTPTVVKSRNLSQPQAEILVKKIAQVAKQSKSEVPKIGIPSSQQPIKVKFNAQGQQPVPSTIEFKSRTAVNGTLAQSNQNEVEFLPSQIPASQPQQPQKPQQPTTTPPTGTTRRVIEILSDRQEYDEQRRVVTAEGNVIVRFDGSVVDADRLQVNLDNLIAVGDGNVALTRGDQVLRGQKFTYNFIQDDGQLEQGSGEIFIPTAGTDLAFQAPGEPSASVGVQRQPLSDRIRQSQPLTGVGSPGGIDFNLGGQADARNIQAPKAGGEVRRIRFEAARIDFYPRGLQARDVRLTNDPFSPPELQIRADKLTLTREAPLRDRIETSGQRLVFDQRTTIPIPIGSRVIDRRERDATPALASVGFDGDVRGGIFVERNFELLNNDTARWSITPQFFAQKAISGGGGNFASLFGLKSKINAVLSPQSRVEGVATFENLDLSQIEDSLRASLRYQQALGSQNPHILNLEYIYRDRLYNGTLGFQRVQSSLGGVLLSPVIPLGRSGLNLNYQVSAQYVNANTDRLDLLEVNRENDRISLGRIQGNLRLSGDIPLWSGKALPPTPTQGLRYTANPVVPYLNAFGEINGTTSYYSNGDSQNTLFGTAGLRGQIGNFSKPFLDYTGFQVSYSQGLNNGLSPFLFDRSVDNKVLNLGIVQQVYGPFRFGFQTSINLDTSQRINTEYSIEYSRRTYGVTLRYNPIQQLGGISFRISDFNWTGGTDPFSDRTEVKPVVGGVEQR